MYNNINYILMGDYSSSLAFFAGLGKCSRGMSSLSELIHLVLALPLTLFIKSANKLRATAF